MRNPLRNLVARPFDKPTIRERVAATRDRLAGKLRRSRDADPVNSVSPELVRLIAECLSATASLYAISDSALGSQTANDAIRRASEARTAVALFQTASGADTWAKARCLAAIYNREVMREEIEAEAGSGVSLDGFALALAAEVIDLTASADASALPVSSPDPILAAIAEAERLRQHVDEVYRLPDIGIDPLPEKEEASGALHDHIMDVLLETVPTTAAGCVALVRFAQRYQDDIGTSMCEGNLALVALIARSPAL
jgi:hypothetical protein